MNMDNNFLSLINFKYEDDEEKAEEFKIISFISMVNGCDCLGIPYGGKQAINSVVNKSLYLQCILYTCIKDT